MLTRLTIITFAAILITGCSSTGDINQNKIATKTVSEVSSSFIEYPDIQDLVSSFEKKHVNSKYSKSIVEVSGEVIAFSLTEEGLYLVTIRDNKSDVICIFDDSLANKLGTNQDVYKGATITVRGQCHASGLFSSNSFSLDGCRLVSN